MSTSTYCLENSMSWGIDVSNIGLCTSEMKARSDERYIILGIFWIFSTLGQTEGQVEAKIGSKF